MFQLGSSTASRPLSRSKAIALLLTISSFVVLLLAVSHGWSHSFDYAISSALQGFRSQAMDALMLTISLMGDGQVTTVVSIACSGCLLWRRSWRLAVVFSLVMLLVSWSVPALKQLLAVPRPHDLYTGGQAFSFPSGHATGASALWGMVAWMACSCSRGSRRWLIGAAAGSLVACVAISRVMLSVHWPSDVVGGILLGASLTLLFALAVNATEVRQARPMSLAVLALLTWVAVGGWHAVTSYPLAKTFYRMGSNEATTHPTTHPTSHKDADDR